MGTDPNAADNRWLREAMENRIPIIYFLGVAPGLYQAIVPNGFPLSKLHHAAFDAHLLGVDPDFQIHVSQRLLIQKDGPMLELLKKMHGEKLHLPAREKERPDRERLAARLDVFRGYE